jgi:hypothetical protein
MAAQVVAVIALGLLGSGGVAKVVDPDPTRGALEAARLPSSRALSRLLGVVEILAAVVGLSLGGTAALLAVLLFLGFTLFTLTAMRRATPIQSCGCFGRVDTPPSWIHVGYNGVASLALAMVVVNQESPVPWAAPPSEFLFYVAFAALGVYLSYLLLTRLPQTLSLAKSS